jgi:hypothetical protein
MASSSLIKTILHRALAEGVYRDVVTRSASYYYFLGKTITWEDDSVPPYPIDSLAYEHDTRNEIITLKEIRPSDVAFVVPRNNWTAGIIYDMYDDQYSDEVIGLNIVSGGSGYIDPTDVSIEITGGGGTGAKFNAVVQDGKIVDVDLVAKGSGYTSTPTVTVVSSSVTSQNGSVAQLKAIVNVAPSGAQRIEDARFYVVTEDYNVYKCLDNAAGSISTQKPTSTSLQPIKTSDNYVWKYMYSIPINLRNKFLTDTHMPVVSALTNQFYSNGSLENIFIANKGAGYTTASISVTGDGYREKDPIFLESVIVGLGGEGYTDQTVITVQDPIANGSAIIANGSINISQIVYNTNFDFYIAENSGTFADYEPTHQEGTVLNGSVALKYLGTRAKAVAVVQDNVEVTPNVFKDGVITGINLIGSVREIRIISPGSGYIDPPSITFSGGGGSYATASPKMYGDKVISASITNQGDGYTTAPTVIIGDEYVALDTVLITEQYYEGTNLFTVEVDGVNGTRSLTTANYTTPIWSIGASVTLNSEVYYANRLYKVTTAGLLGTTAPTHITGTESNGSADLEYIGKPLIVSSAPFSSGGVATLGETVYVSNRLYKVTTAGLLGDDAPTHTTGSQPSGTSVLEYLGQPSKYSYAGARATGVSVLRFGTGYSSTPLIVITDQDNGGSGADANFLTSKSEAKLIPIIENGQVQYVIIEEGGIGYTKATIEVVDTGTTGRGASLIADLSIGAIGSQQANNEILTPPGTIDAINVISGGYSYGVANITITGDGTGATAVAIIDPVTNSISRIRVTNRGSNYTYADVTITGNGYGAKVRAIITPYGGHGKSSPEELYARTLMFYSNISTDLNQGMSVNNDYRQVGIIKNPRVFSDVEYYQGSIGSACFVVQTTLNTEEFPRDSMIYIERSVPPDTEWTASTSYTIGTYLYAADRIYIVITAGTSSRTAPTVVDGTEVNGTMVVSYVGSTKVKKRYRIVSSTTQSALLQSLDNDIPVVTDIFTSEANNAHSFTVASVGNPNVDKYSGQILFIDNKQGFTPSADETITLRTIIQF